MKNRITSSCYVTLLVLCLLLLLHYVPRPVLMGQRLRAVDLLSDVRTKKLHDHTSSPVESEPIDTIAFMAEAMPIDTVYAAPTAPAPSYDLPLFVDTCRSGLVCIEDYSDSTRRGMLPFYKALSDLQVSPRAVRIAYYGDSFIEGDIITGDLRSMLQSRYGGSGVGYVPLNSVSMGFRTSVRQSSEGWERHSAMDASHFDRSKQDVGNYYFRASTLPATVNLDGQKRYYRHLDTCYHSSFIFIPDTLTRISAQVNGLTVVDGQTFSGTHLQQLEVSGSIHSLKFSVEQASDSALFYGVCMDDTYGVSLDNFSLRGSSGVNLNGIPQQTMHQWAQMRPYDLVVLQYGLNVATEEQLDYGYYVRGMSYVIDRIKACYPTAGILVVSVADRDYRTEDGEVRSMPGIISLVAHQQRLAASKGVAFWNLFAAMGGEESMKSLVEATPPMANQDYTHINSRGGHHVATLLFDALMHGKEEFDKHYEPHDDI